MDRGIDGKRRKQQTVDSPPCTFVVCAESCAGAERERMEVFSRGPYAVGNHGIGRTRIENGSMGGTCGVAEALRSFDHDNHCADGGGGSAMPVDDGEWIGPVASSLGAE